MKNQTIAVVGSTGKTGSRVLSQLQCLGYATRALSRCSTSVFDWSDRSTWSKALEGAVSTYVSYFPDLAVPQSEDDIRAFVDVAKTQGVKHIVLLSGRGEEGAEKAERVVQDSGLDWNIIRASWFMQNFSESFMLDGLKAGELLLPESKADEPFIDVDDIAEVAVAALIRSELRNQLLEVTGPELLSFKVCVDSIAKASGRNIGFQEVPIDDYLVAAREQGLTEDMAWLIRELFVEVLDGRNASMTDTIEQVLGRPAKSFEDYVRTTAKQAVWSAPETQASEEFERGLS
ncbi:MAG: NAD(P)H-binding protein [Cellvibrionaceae bacterium]